MLAHVVQHGRQQLRPARRDGRFCVCASMCDQHEKLDTAAKWMGAAKRGVGCLADALLASSSHTCMLAADGTGIHNRCMRTCVQDSRRSSWPLLAQKIQAGEWIAFSQLLQEAPFDAVRQVRTRAVGCVGGTALLLSACCIDCQHALAVTADAWPALELLLSARKWRQQHPLMCPLTPTPAPPCACCTGLLLHPMGAAAI